MNQLNVDDLLKTAQQRTGLSDFGPTDFLEGLTVLVDGINTEAQIHPERWQQMVEQRFVRLLINRLWFAKDLADHPEILDEDIGSPIIIASLPRTGSTKLHRMLGATQDFQTLFLWSAHMFARIPGLPEGGRARRIQETRDYEAWLYRTSPSLVTGHPLYTNEPEEDQFLMEGSFRHTLLFGMFHSLKYAQWIAQADMKPTFDYYVTQLKYLQWQSGKQSGKHGRPWLLKTPQHLGCEQLLTRIFNKPRFIITHRDPAKCIPSVTNTAMVMRKLYSDLDSSNTLAAGTLSVFPRCTAEHIKWRDSNPAIDILDLGFREITEDGVGTARKVYDFLGLPFSASAELGILRWEQNNPKDKHGKGAYTSAAIGTTDDAIRQAFAPYIERFSAYI